MTEQAEGAERMEKEKISVIIPVYNGADWLNACVESVLGQSRRELEILILDDHSTDETPRVAQALMQRDVRVRYVFHRGHGVSSARNQGIEETDGAYLTFVDADDKLEERMLERLAEALEKTGADFVTCEYAVWDGKTTDPPDGGEERSCPEESCRVLDREGWLSERLLRGAARCWGILYRREAVGSVRFRETLSIGEDMMFLMDLLPGLNRVGVLTYPGYYYRIHPEGVMLRPFIPSYMDEIHSWRLAAQRIEQDYPGHRARVNSILAVSAMLAAGKLALLPRRERGRYRSCVRECRETVQEALDTPGARGELPGGYRIKTTLFLLSPSLYMALYHLWKSRKRPGASGSGPGLSADM